MKKSIAFLLVLAVFVGISGCKATTQQKPTEATQETTEAVSTEVTAAPTEATSAPTEMPTGETDETSTVAPTDVTADITVTTEATTAPTTAPTEVPTEAPTEEPHSEFYATGISVDQIIAHFNKVVLGMENATGGGETALVQKWDQPISYRIEGMPSRQDSQIINKLAKQLNAVEGFPGIQAATGLEQNVTIYFLKDGEFESQFSHIMEGKSENSVVQIWYGDSNGISSGRIGYRQEAEQDIRDAAIQEELMKLLGISDVSLQKRTPVNKKDTITVELSELDWAVVKLLYNPRIHSDMNADECEMIIRELYY